MHELAFSASFRQRMGLIFAILCRLKKAVLETCFICEVKDKSWTKMTPRFLTVALEAKVMSVYYHIVYF